MKSFMHKLGNVSFYAIMFYFVASNARAQQGGIPFNPDAYFGKQPGMIAVRGATRWQAIPAGASGQVLSSQGPNTVPSWITPSGTGNVQTDGNAAANSIPYFANGTTLSYRSPGGAALDALLGISGSTPVGYMKRTGSGAYSEAAIPSSDLPAFAADSDNSCLSTVGSGKLTCAGIYQTSHTFSASQTFDNQSGSTPAIHVSPSSYSGNGGTINKIDLFNNGFGFGISSGQLDLVASSSFGFWNNSTLTASLDGNGVFSPKTLAPVNSLAVAYGGTGCTSASGTCLDNISGLNGNGFIQRYGAGAYQTASIHQVLDTLGTSGGNPPAQGDIIYRGPGSQFQANWYVLHPGTSGQFLGSNGAGAAPSWQSPSAPPAGSRVLLNTLSPASGASSADDTSSITSSFTEYDIVIENFVPTANALCQIQLYIGGAKQTANYVGTVFSASNYNGGSNATTSPTNYIGCGGNGNDLVTSSAQSSSSAGTTAEFHISNPARTSRNIVRSRFGNDVFNSSVNVTEETGNASGYNATSGAITGLSFSFGGTTIASGKIKIYGSN